MLDSPPLKKQEPEIRDFKKPVKMAGTEGENVLRALIHGASWFGGPSDTSLVETDSASDRPIAQRSAKLAPSGPQNISIAHPRKQSNAAPQRAIGQIRSSPLAMSTTESDLTLVQAKILELLRPSTNLEVEVRGKSQELATLLRDPATRECPVPEFTVSLCSEIASLGCRVVLRKVKNTHNYWSRSITRTFALCVVPGAAQDSRPRGLLVDPNFKEHFLTANSTSRYRGIWSCLPEVFVGQASQLISVLKLICSEMALSFESCDGTLPPWRSYEASVRRWTSNSFVDALVPMAGPRLGPSKGQADDFLKRCWPQAMQQDSQRQLSKSTHLHEQRSLEDPLYTHRRKAVVVGFDVKQPE